MSRYLDSLVPVLALAFAASAVRAQNPMTDAMRAEYPTHEHNIVGAFERMPAEKYGFKPTPELMTFGELALHIGGANVYYCRRVSNASFQWPMPRLTPTSPKEQLVAFVKSSFDYCRPMVTQAVDASFGENIPSNPSPPVTKASVLLLFFSGMDHHYGQAAGYLRLNNLLPPTADAGK